jgi:hypothetical protein
MAVRARGDGGATQVVMGGMGLCILAAIPSYLIIDEHPRSTVDLFFAIVVILGVAQVRLMRE